ncbi:MULTISPECIES: beta-ketoacyl-ACP synthase 3 [unclassified Streptomyces]|uniref:beta-ketoacyl-ACP synthase 3 n=1 Tax=unclassified Streptomyces TaxID=2593676 RepID=UPI00168AF7C8|nr:beta-ketoacyl-ACP synthase 3 [Streptomyces sp. 5-10]MBD3003749.1 beta-ketoacyl-ACP synthase 3 [Streptomyces sp. 5-10]
MTKVAVLAGIGGFLPPLTVTNDELARRLDTSDDWIRTRTGITQRHFASPGTTTSSLAAEAAGKAMKCAETDTVDAVLLATTTPDRPCPATAPTVAAKLGLEGVAAYDISAVCSGFLYGLATASGLIAGGIAERVLVIGADVYSTIVDPADRSNAVIFGDGAGAVVVRAGHPGEPGAMGPFDLGSDGTGRDLITVRAGGVEQRLSGRTAQPSDRYFTMSGKPVFRSAVHRMAASARAVLDQAGLTAGHVDRLVGHQANLRILRSLAEKLGIPPERVIRNIDKVGNTAAASIPLALDHGHSHRLLTPGDVVLLTAFGGGLTWGSTVLSWPELPRLHDSSDTTQKDGPAMSATLEEVVGILTDRFTVERSKMTPETTFEDLDFDSLFLVEFQLVLEERFKVLIEEDTISPMDTLSSVAGLIDARRARGDR